MAVSAEQFIVLVLSISCGVLGGFLLAHRGVRMMRGGLLYRLSVGLAAVGIALSLSAGFRILLADTILPDAFLVLALVVLFYIGYSAWLSAHQMPAEARDRGGTGGEGSHRGRHAGYLGRHGPRDAPQEASRRPRGSLELDGRRSREDRRSLARADPPFDHGRGRRRGEGEAISGLGHERELSFSRPGS